jgi:hypothetical protein
MDSGFVNALAEATVGIRKAEECARILLGAALDDVLLRIASDHNLNFTKLVEDYKDVIIDNHATFSDGKIACKGLTATGKHCSRAAIAGGYCKAHASQGIVANQKDKAAKSYARTVVKQDLANGLKRLGIDHVEFQKFKVSKKEVSSDFF